MKESRHLRTSYKFKDITCSFFIWFSDDSLPESDKIVLLRGSVVQALQYYLLCDRNSRLFHQGSLRRYSSHVGTSVINSTLEIVPVPDYLPSAVGTLFGQQ